MFSSNEIILIPSESLKIIGQIFPFTGFIIIITKNSTNKLISCLVFQNNLHLVINFKEPLMFVSFLKSSLYWN
jgi:hypothetical protein